MDGQKFGARLASLIKALREMGISLLDEMESTDQISPEERQTLQYEFCSGLSSAHFAMGQPKEAVASHNNISKDRQISSAIDHGIRIAAENLLENILGENWRQWERVEDDFRLLDERVGKQCAGFSARFAGLHKAVRVKPSEVRARLDQPVTVKCSHCHQPGHAARLCPFKSHGVTTGREPCDGGGSEAGRGPRTD